MAITWQATPDYRWFAEWYQGPPNKRLQRAWQCVETGDVEWHDVEIVFSEEPSDAG